MLATLRRLTIATSLTALFSLSAWGQSPTAAFEGIVKGDDGKPLPKATVHLERTDQKGSYKVNTDKKGHYFYMGLPVGTYRISVDVDGKERDFITGVKGHVGDPIVQDFDLHAKATSSADRQAAIQKAVANGGTLSAEETRNMSPEQKAALEKKMKDAAATMSKNKALNDAYNAGKNAMDAKQYDAAVESFEKAKGIDPNQNVIWASLADAYAADAKTKTGADQQALYDKGIESYKKAIEMKPDDAAYHNNYALLLAGDKKSDEALVELDKAAQLDPPNAGKYYYNGGAVLVNLGQNDAAGQMFKKAIAGDANYADAHYQYGIYLIGKATTTTDGKIVPPEGTADEFQKYLELKPDGQFADSAKAMLASLGAKVQTQLSTKPTTTTKKKP